MKTAAKMKGPPRTFDRSDQAGRVSHIDPTILLREVVGVGVGPDRSGRGEMQAILSDDVCSSLSAAASGLFVMFDSAGNFFGTCRRLPGSWILMNKAEFESELRINFREAHEAYEVAKFYIRSAMRSNIKHH